MFVSYGVKHNKQVVNKRWHKHIITCLQKWSSSVGLFIVVNDVVLICINKSWTKILLFWYQSYYLHYRTLIRLDGISNMFNQFQWEINLYRQNCILYFFTKLWNNFTKSRVQTKHLQINSKEKRCYSEQTICFSLFV